MPKKKEINHCVLFMLLQQDELDQSSQSVSLLSVCQFFGDTDSNDPVIDQYVGNRIRLSHKSLFSQSVLKMEDRETSDVMTTCVSGWIYVTCDWCSVQNKEKQRVILFKGNQDDYFKLYLDKYSNRLMFDAQWSHGRLELVSNVQIPLFKWTHVAVTFHNTQDTTTRESSSVITLLIDGEVCARKEQCSFSCSANKWPIYVGTDEKFGNSFVGCMENVKWSVHPQFTKEKQLVESLMSEKPRYPSDTAFQRELHIRSRPWSSVRQLEAWEPGIDPMNRASIRFQQRPKDFKRKVIHCHDMKGGYLEDAMTQGYNQPCVYNFKHWQYIDYFIYFSHERIAIPPVGWINTAHKNGVKCFATFITEWDEGRKETLYLLSKDENGQRYADKLIDMAEYYGFDGWFFNIENTLPDLVSVQKLIRFLDYMTQEMHRRIPGSLVIWYDSITIDGELKWQNALTLKNKPFFDVCDAIFLNYCWNPELLLKTAQLAGERKEDVFVGIDIFGRNTYGGGGYTTHVALEEIEKCDLSVALFAPGWTFETCGASGDSIARRLMFEDNEARFWNGIRQYQLLKNFSGESNLEHWKVVINGGDGWAVESNGFRDKCFVTSYQPCTKEQRIDLLDYADIIPRCGTVAIRFGVWYKGTGPNFADEVFMELELRSEDESVLRSFSSGKVECSNQWNLLSGQFEVTGQELDKLRFIIFRDGGRDVEYWAGHFGSRLSDPFVSIQTKEEGFAGFYEERPIAATNGEPFTSNFNTGVGSKYFIEGIERSCKPWNNLSDQSILPSYMTSDKATLHQSISVTFYYEEAFCGGSSLMFAKQNFNPRSDSVYSLFKTCLDLRNGYFITTITKALQPSSRAVLVLLDEDNTIHYLLPSCAPEISADGITHRIESTISNVNGWRRETVMIPRDMVSSVIRSIGICCYSLSDINCEYKLLLGQLTVGYTHLVPDREQLKIGDGGFSLTWLPQSMNEPDDELICHINLHWSISDSSTKTTLSYYIFQDDSPVGRSFSPYYRINSVKGLNEGALKFIVLPVNDSTGVLLKEQQIEILVTASSNIL